MRIKNITLVNVRAYHGINSINFANNLNDRNITIISGKNGFGKTTFLTSLIWCFYGKMMIEVEEKYKVDIKNFGGYDRFLGTLISNTLTQDDDQKLSVSIEFEDIFIPSIPCNSLIIRRTFCKKNNAETLEILIDGSENELTKQVGFDVFINDFILPREIAKFFFFDAEKIVSLAEARSRTELKSLSKAYSEVLGIKKYEDLKKNLIAIISKYKRNGAAKNEREKLDNFTKRQAELTSLIDLNEDQLKNVIENITSLKSKSDILQEKLIREGSKITLDDLKILKRERDQLKSQSIDIKNKLRNYLDIIPLVLSGKKLDNLHAQIKDERSLISNNVNTLISEFKNYSEDLISDIKIKISDNNVKNDIIKLISDSLEKKINEKSNLVTNKPLLNLSSESINTFEGIYSKIKNSFANQFQNIVQEEKNIRILLNRTLQKIKEAEAKDENPVHIRIREDKYKIDEQIISLTAEKENLIEEKGSLKSKLISTLKVISEFEKQFTVQELDRKKYELSKDLLEKVTEIINRIKQEKRYSLENSILRELNKIMHKDDFVKSVKVNIFDDYMDIDLLDNDSKIIDKNLLSKGEQQLYATALLKALVDESGISFPVFIDSPLQKFDKSHSTNIIMEFYPNISKQVVLFPLLEKELTYDEFGLMQKYINNVYLIDNVGKRSKFNLINDFKDLFKFKPEDYVYPN